MNPKEGFELGQWGKVTILVWNYKLRLGYKARIRVYAYGY
jgi:hypothetical protein